MMVGLKKLLMILLVERPEDCLGPLMNVLGKSQ